MAEYNSLEKIRLQKLEELRAEGVEAYPTRAARTHTSAQAIDAFESDETKEVKVTLAGRIRSMRPKGKLSFVHIEDGDGKIQLFFRVNEVGEGRLAFLNKMFDLGDFIGRHRFARRGGDGENRMAQREQHGECEEETGRRWARGAHHGLGAAACSISARHSARGPAVAAAISRSVRRNTKIEWPRSASAPRTRR